MRIIILCIINLLLYTKIIGQNDTVYRAVDQTKIITLQGDYVQDTARTKTRHLSIIADIKDGINLYDLVNGFPVNIFVYSEKGDVYSFPGEQLVGFNLDPGKYKVVFTKVGYKSKLLEVEVVDYKSKGTPWYQIPIYVKLFPGIDERQLEPVGRIFYNSKTDYYQTEQYPLTTLPNKN